MSAFLGFPPPPAFKLAIFMRFDTLEKVLKESSDILSSDHGIYPIERGTHLTFYMLSFIKLTHGGLLGWWCGGQAPQRPVHLSHTHEQVMRGDLRQYLRPQGHLSLPGERLTKALVPRRPQLSRPQEASGRSTPAGLPSPHQRPATSRSTDLGARPADVISPPPQRAPQFPPRPFSRRPPRQRLLAL